MARIYVNNIYRIYGALKLIISNYRSQFILDFQDKFYFILRIKIRLSTIFHFQTNGQTKIINQYLNQRLRPFVNYYQDNQLELLQKGTVSLRQEVRMLSVSQSICLSVSWSVGHNQSKVISKAVYKKGKKRIYSGRFVISKKEGSRRLNIYRKMLKH